MATLAMLSCDAWSLVSWYIESPLLGLIRLGPPEYVALIVFFTGIILLLNFEFLRSLLPREKFYNLQNDIQGIIRDYTQFTWAMDADSVISRCGKLAKELDRLGVPHPDLSTINNREWWDWLNELYALSATKDLKAARAYKVMEGKNDSR